jgi:tRNA1Val (adenine37-N6)-methyltransferase
MLDSNTFYFKQFAVKHEFSSMKVGFDGILLGAWCDVINAETILDIGTGTGLIAMICAQKNAEAQITGIEPDLGSCSDAEFNFRNSPNSARFVLFKGTLREFQKANEIGFDHIISNPPFFNNTLPPENQSKKISRHTVTLSHTEILQFFITNSTDNGKLSLILPLMQSYKLLAIAAKMQIHNSRQTIVITKGVKKRTLLEFRKTVNTEPQINDLIVYDNDGAYTREYIDLVKDLYLNM